MSGHAASITAARPASAAGVAAAPHPRASFRARLGPSVTRAVLVTGVLYAGLKLLPASGMSPLTSYPFGIAAAGGLLLFVLGALAHRHDAVSVDPEGIVDQRTGVALRWEEIASVSVRIVDLAATSGVPVKARVVTLAGEGREIRFGDLGAGVHTEGVRNLAEASLLLAVVASRTGSLELFPEAWRAHPSPASEPAGLDGAAAQDADPSAAPQHAVGGTHPSPAAASGVPARARWRPSTAGLWGSIALGLKLLPKLGVAAVKLLKSVKLGAAVVTLGAYALVFSWPFAVAFLGLLLVHELGHVFAMRRAGLSVRGVYFIPFLGAVAVSKGLAASRRDNAYVAINGPVWGAISVLACAAAYVLTGGAWPMLATVAAWGALLNLFNLLPILPLDGGRILDNTAHSLGSSTGVIAVVASLVLGGLLAYVARLDLLVLMVWVGLFEVGNHIAALPYRGALALLGPERPLEADTYERFSQMVSRVERGRRAATQVEARRATFELRKASALQVPMRPREVALGVAGYLALIVLLVGVVVALDALPGVGSGLHLLR